jgi:hypothetical protein
MTPEERSTTALIDTCRRILEEPDPVKFQRLVAELVDLLDRVAPGCGGVDFDRDSGTG